MRDSHRRKRFVSKRGRRSALRRNVNIPKKPSRVVPVYRALRRDYSRFLRKGFAVIDVEGDGNCQFRAVAESLRVSSGVHVHFHVLRERAVDFIRKNVSYFRPFFYDGFDEHYYSVTMRHNKTWGDHVTLVAMAGFLRVKIYVMGATKFHDCVCHFESNTVQTDRLPRLFVGHIPEVHYVSLQPM